MSVASGLRIAIADASNLIYSDDYRDGWVWGFKQLGADVRVFDISTLSGQPLDPAATMVSRKGWMHHGKLLADLIGKFRPHIVFSHHGRAAANRVFQERLKSYRTLSVVYLCDEPYEVGETARWSQAFNFVFSIDPCTLGIHRAARGSKKGVFYLPPGVNTDHFKFVPYESRVDPCPALFLGNASLVPRIDYLKAVERCIKGTRILYWATVAKQHKKQWIPLGDHPKLYSSCMLGLNVHRDPSITQQCYRDRVMLRKAKPVQGIEKCKTPPTRWGTGFWNDCNAPAAHVNPRFFEMAAVGTCVLSDADRPELARMFPIAPRARNPQEYLEMAEWLLAHPEHLKLVGEECSSLILRRHTYAHRAAEVLVRTGLLDASAVSKSLCWEEPQEWLTPQDFDERGVIQSLVPTGLYEHFDPRSGSSATRMSGRPSGPGSLRLRQPWD